MKDRIQKYIDYKNIAAGELATILEVQRSNISHILNGRNKPGASFIEKLLLNFPDLNARWLLTGQGEMVDGALQAVKTEVQPEVQSKGKGQKISPAPVEVEKEDKTKTNSINNKTIDKVVLLYKDGTFKDFSYNKHTLDD